MMTAVENSFSLTSVAVLTSGGLDSDILVAHLARTHAQALFHPLYIRSDLAWEAFERQYLQRYLEALRPRFDNIAQLVELQQPTQDLYGAHWSITGTAVPDEHSRDEAVYLPGRNALLTLKALLWCHLHDVSHLALGILASNPFPDAAPSFLTAFATAIGQAVNNSSLRIITPFSRLRKTEVLQLGCDLPLEYSFSCIHPLPTLPPEGGGLGGGLHCGHCNKCAERKDAFRSANLPDLTRYAS